MATEASHFTRDEQGTYLPTEFAQSHWGDDHLNGPAVVGLAAHALENHCGAPEFMPTRITVDLFRAARGVPTTVDVRTIRDGRRVRSTQCDVVQNGRAVARATLLQYRRSAAPPGRQWTAPTAFPSLPPRDDALAPFVGSEAVGWTRSPASHQNDSRKYYYINGIDAVAGQPNTPFVRAVMVGESTSLVTNLGTHGIGYINGDLTVGLSRLPLDEWVGIQGDSHWASDGIAVGTATLFDTHGPIGSGMVTAVANPAAQIDFTNDRFPTRGFSFE